MRIAIISDIHGNYPALKAVLADAVENNVEQYIFIGDYIFDLPFSNKVIRTLMKLPNAYIISGNKEVYLKVLNSESQKEWASKQMGVIYQTYKELQDDVFDFLLDLQEECYITLNSGKTIYAIHYLKGMEQKDKILCGSSKFYKKMVSNPFSHHEYLEEFKEVLNQSYLSNMLNTISADVILFGHNHLQSYGYCGNRLVINPGSCGQALDFNNNAPYTILEESADSFNVIERRVPYDIETTIETARKTSIYMNGAIWSELCFLAIRTGRDYFGIFFEIASRIAETKGEKGKLFSNETFEAAYSDFLKIV